MTGIDWSNLLVPRESLLEIALRGTLVYLALFVAMRLLPRREIGGVGPSDILVVVLIADAVQNAMAGGYESVTEGLLLAAVIIGWATLIDWVAYRFPELHLAEAAPLRVIRDGKFLHENMKRDQLSEDELLAQLRQHGLDSAERVAAAFIEGDGSLSVLLKGGAALRPPKKRQAQAGMG